MAARHCYAEAAFHPFVQDKDVRPLKLKVKCKSQPPVTKEHEEDLSFFEEWANDDVI